MDVYKDIYVMYNKMYFRVTMDHGLSQRKVSKWKNVYNNLLSSKSYNKTYLKQRILDYAKMYDETHIYNEPGLVIVCLHTTFSC